MAGDVDLEFDEVALAHLAAGGDEAAPGAELRDLGRDLLGVLAHQGDAEAHAVALVGAPLTTPLG